MSYQSPACQPDRGNPWPEVGEDERNPFCEVDANGNPVGSDGECQNDPEELGYSYAREQNPNPGEEVEVKEKYKINQTKSPEPKCGGSCNCSPGEVKKQKDETKATGKKETAKVKIKLTGLSVSCKCQDKDGKSINWSQECEDTEIEVEEEVEVFGQTWDEVYDVSCDCYIAPGCNCSESYTVTTTYGRDFYKAPQPKIPQKIPGCECSADAPKKDCDDVPPCKPVSHNYGPKCNGCGGTHGGTAPPPPPSSGPTTGPTTGPT